VIASPNPLASSPLPAASTEVQGTKIVSQCGLLRWMVRLLWGVVYRQIIAQVRWHTVPGCGSIGREGIRTVVKAVGYQGGY